MDPKPEWWILDPMNENSNGKMIRQHMEALYKNANKDQWNTRRFAGAATFKLPMQACTKRSLHKIVAITPTTTFADWQAVAKWCKLGTRM